MTWGVRSLRTKEDVISLNIGDHVVTDQGFEVAVSSIHKFTSSGDVLIAGVVRSYYHPYQVNQGTYIYWGPKGMALSFLNYESKIFIGRK